MTGPQSGGCLCGRVTYSIHSDAEPVYSVICHCENCKKATGTHFICNTIYQKSHFTLTSGTPKAYHDSATDSGKPLYRHFCGDCGSSLFITTPLAEGIVSILSGTLDGAAKNWMPNKEQYIEAKSHWLSRFNVFEKAGVEPKHERGPNLNVLKTEPFG